jgi:GSH-dependent disulfide-bond oxidoreductase
LTGWLRRPGERIHALTLRFRSANVKCDIGQSEYLAGDTYTIADMATWPWTHSIDKQGHDPGQYPNVLRWSRTIAERPAARRGVKVLRERRHLEMTEAERQVLFGSRPAEGG